MAKRILVVQSRTDPARIERERKNFERAVGGAAELEFLSTLDERLAWSTPDEFLEGRDGVIFGGSSDFDFNGGRHEKDPVRIMSFMLLSRTRNLIAYALEHGLPLLGICYGHQLIANRYGGLVDNDPAQSKVGSHEVTRTDEGARDEIFKYLPETFMAQYAHKDSVTKLPEGATLLGSSPKCRFAALRYGQRAYTVQFHPETERFEDLKLEYKDSKEASRIIPLWIEHVVGRG